MPRKNKQDQRLLIISGFSGAGKSLVLNTLEDQGFYCIDNLPIGLFQQLATLLTDTSNDFPLNVGIGIDVRIPESDLASLPNAISELKAKGIATEVVFMEANKKALTARFSETRRKHPLSSNNLTLSDALDKETQILSSLSDIADLKIDTSFTTVHELRDLVRDHVAYKSEGNLSIQFTSFGYKNGVPNDADFLFDVRCLPNPHWEKHLRPYSGKDQVVIDFLKQQPTVEEMVVYLRDFLERWIPDFEAENRSYLCIGIGCTGGHHRSVYIVEQLSRYFEQNGKNIVVRHRDL